MWLDHRGPTGAYNSSPANGKPWLIGFGPGQYASGLGLFPKSGSPAINLGTLVSEIRYPNDDVHIVFGNILFPLGENIFQLELTDTVHPKKWRYGLDDLGHRLIRISKEKENK